MSKGTTPNRKRDSGRDEGGFVALPWSVLDCPAYTGLSHPARALLLELARQFVLDNNGRLLASAAHMSKRGWKSADVITRAKRDLLEAGFIHETVKGHRPNKASWYAVTWRTLDKLPGYDPGAAETFKRGAYKAQAQLAAKLSRDEIYAKWRQPAVTNCASLRPSAGVEAVPIAPSAGVGALPIAPSAGAIDVTFDGLSTPSRGNHLEMPSPVPGFPVPIPASRTRMGQLLRCVRPTNRPNSHQVARARFVNLNMS